MASADTDDAKADTGFIRFQTEISKIRTAGIYSHVVEVCELPWSIFLRRSVCSNFLTVYLHHRETNSNLWNIDVSIVFKVVNFNNNGTHFTEKFNVSYSKKIPTWGYDEYMPWKDLINEEKGFIKDGKITVEASFTLSKISGFMIPHSFDFLNPAPDFDAELMIGGKKIYVGKQVLACHSSYFQSYFYDDDSGQRKDKEKELKDIDHKEFIEMLYLIYPSFKKISDSNAEHLIKLGTQFQIRKIVKKVEKYFINSTSKTLFMKFAFSDKHKLVKLQEHCLTSFKTAKEIHDLQHCEGYKNLSENAMTSLLQRINSLNLE